MKRDSFSNRDVSDNPVSNRDVILAAKSVFRMVFSRSWWLRLMSAIVNRLEIKRECTIIRSAKGAFGILSEWLMVLRLSAIMVTQSLKRVTAKRRMPCTMSSNDAPNLAENRLATTSHEEWSSHCAVRPGHQTVGKLHLRRQNTPSYTYPPFHLANMQTIAVHGRSAFSLDNRIGNAHNRHFCRSCKHRCRHSPCEDVQQLAVARALRGESHGFRTRCPLSRS